MRPRPFAGLDGWTLARRIVAPALFVGALFVSVLTYEAPPPPTLEELALDELELSGEALGTTWTVRVVGNTPDAAGQEALVDAIAGALGEVDALMSTWRDDSELSRFNQSRSVEPVFVSAPTLAVLMRAEAVWRASDGAFDATVYPLVRAWGFGGASAGDAPEDNVLETILAEVGQQHITLDHQASTVTKALPGLTVDLSAIAKGYAVDRVSLAIDALGHRHHMVEVGGEVRTRGLNRLKQPWRIAVERPDTLVRTVEEVVKLSTGGMATSGDYRNYRELDGRRVSHTIDPRTGQPVSHRLASVTVLHPECALADAWATALMVLGPDRGLEVAESEDLAVLMLVRTDAGFEQRASAAFLRHQAAGRGILARPGTTDARPVRSPTEAP